MSAMLLLAFVLDIPARKQHADAPPSGWCGETAIQEGLLHLGVWASQRLIHKAGNSKHPDLYSNEIPTALTTLGVPYTAYAPKKGSSYASFVTDALDTGDPVLAGVKILPSEHPTWGLDHFVLVVGHGEKGFLANTTWGTRVWANEKTSEGISFKNAFYALRLTMTRTARLVVLDETSSTVKLRVECLANGDARIERRKRASDKTTEWSVAVPAKSHASTVVTLDAESEAHFACITSPP